MPFEQRNIGGWLIEVDREATQAVYRNALPISDCTCVYCQNYFAACQANTAYSPTAVTFFQSLGIAPEKEAEVGSLYANQGRTKVYYTGCYHLVGRIIKSAEGQAYTWVDDELQVAFTEKVSLLPEGFPQPALQLDFSSFIPWVLDAQRDALVALDALAP